MNILTRSTPLVAAAVLAAAWWWPLNGALLLLCVLALIAAVLVAVHHAEVVAHRVGEPMGTLVLALDVTIIDGGLDSVHDVDWR